jgi:hypothetical protein
VHEIAAYVADALMESGHALSRSLAITRTELFSAQGSALLAKAR